MFTVRGAAARLVATVAAASVLLSGLPVEAATASPPLATTSTGRPLLIIGDRALGEISASRDGVVVDWRAQIRTRADALLTQPPVSYGSSDMLDLSREVVSRAYDLGLIWQMTGDRRFAERLWAELDAVAAFPTWDPVNDLSLGEMAHGVAIGLDWTRGYAGADRRARVIEALRLRALEPAAAEYRSPATSMWVDRVTNWNVVINGGVTLAALATADDLPQLSSAILSSARASIPRGLQAYGSSGAYLDGLTYWQYSTTYLVTMAAGLRTTAGGDDWGLMSDARVRATSQFPTALLGPSNRSFNFGDAWSTEPFTEPLLGLAALAGDDRALTRALTGYAGSSGDRVTPRSLLWYMDSRARVAPVAPLDQRFPDAGIFAARSSWADERASFMAFKFSPTAPNGHQDQDAGTFVYDALGVNWFSDLGADDYGLDGYFDASGPRWDYYRKLPAGHNTISFDGASAGSIGTTGRFVSSVSRPDVTGAVADLSSAAPAGVTWQRGMKLVEGREQLVIQDEVRANAPTSFTSNLHTRADIALATDRRSAVLSLQGQQVLVRLLSPAGATLTASEAGPSAALPQPAGQDANEAFSKLEVRMTNVTSATVALQITPVVAGRATPAQAAVVPVASWSSSSPSASLTSLTVGGVPVAGFRPDALSYFVGATASESVPRVTATAPSGTTVAITPPTALPGTATVTVTRVGHLRQVYRVHLARGPLGALRVSATTQASLAPAVLDGDLYSRWEARGFHRLQFDLGSSRKLNHLELNWGAGVSGVPYTVQISQDGGNWTTVYQGTSRSTRTFEWASFTTGARDARYARVTVNSDAKDRLAALNEVRFFGDNAPRVSPSPQTPRPDMDASGPQTLHVGETGALSAEVRLGTQVVSTTVAHRSSRAEVLRVDGERAAGVAAGDAVVVSEAQHMGWIVRDRTPVQVVDSTRLELAPTADAHVQGGAVADTNYRNSRQMFVRHVDAYPEFDRYAYLSFDLRDVAPERIRSATLSMTAGVDGGGGPQPIDARSVSAPWSASTLTFNTKPALGAAIGRATVPAGAASRIDMDLTEYVRLRAGGIGSLGITEDRPAGGAGLLVAIDSSRTANPPMLVIDLEPAGTAALPAAPSIGAARSSTPSALGEVRGTVAGPAGVAASVEVFTSPIGACLPVTHAAEPVGAASIRFDAAGTASFVVAGNIPLGSAVFARAVVAGRSSLGSDCFTAADSQVLITPSADVHVQGGAVGDTNYRKSQQLYIRHVDAYPQFDRYGYMRFDLGDIDGSRVQSAVLTFSASVTGDASQALHALPVDAAWDPATVTFNSRPPMLAGVVGRTDVPPGSATRVEMDLSDYVRARAGSSASIGLTQIDPPGGVGLLVAVDSSRTANPPTLTVTYAP